MTQPPPFGAPPATPRPLTLADAVIQARHPRNHAMTQLTPHRDELLRLRAAGESIETLAHALCLLGVDIGKETLRRWLAVETGIRPKRKARRNRAAASAVSGSPVPPNDGMLAL